MKNNLIRASLSLIALVCCFLMSEAKTSASAALPTEILSGIPSGFQNYFEKHEEIEGELEVIAECEETDGRTLYFVNTPAGRVSIQLDKGLDAQLTTGSRVRVKGIRVGDSVIAADTIEPLDSDAQDLVSAGERKVLVILVNFQDRQTQPFTADHARNMTFNTTSNYVRENSYGQTWLTGDVYGWFTIPLNSTVCDTVGISTNALQAAANAGANLAAYDHYVFAFPQTMACPWSGGSTVGGNPSKAWINTDNYGIEVLGHELGHSLGLSHSRSLDCGTLVIGGTCTTNEYGDKFDIMGPNMPYHFNAYQKERLGWLNAAGMPPVTTISSSGTYYIDAYETVGTGSKGLKFLRSIDPVTGYRTWYYIEHRTPTGFDTPLSAYNIQNGVVFHSGKEGSGQENYLLDMTPLTASWYDSSLMVGQTYTDAATGNTFTVLAADNAGASVRFDMASQSCVRMNPSLAISSPQGQGGPPGSTVGFQLTLTNNDIGTCGSSPFSIQANAPTGWTVVVGSPAPVLDQGASLTTTLQVTSAANTTGSLHPITLTAANSLSPANVGSATVTIEVVVPVCVRSNPTLAVSPGQSPGVPAGTTVSFSVTVTNNDTGGCGVSGFNLQSAVPTNWTASFSSQTLQIAQAASASATLQVTSPIGSASGTYPVNINTLNNTSPTNTASSAVQVQISPPSCVRSNPTLTVSPGQSPGVPAGSSVSFSVTVRNNDTGGCGESAFNLQASAPANWVAGFGAQTLVIGQGSTSSTTLQITSPAGTTSGLYPINLSVANNSSAAHTASAAVQVEITPPPCVRSNPTLTVGQAQGPAVTAGTTVTFNLTVSNNDTGGCGASAFNLQAQLSAGWSGTFGSSTVSINQGSGATTTLQITSPTGIPDGSYPIVVNVANNSAPSSASSATITYSIVSAGMSVIVVPTRSSYTRNETVTANATVRIGGVVASGAPVIFTMTKANGTVITATRTTGTNGVATFTYVLSRRKDPTGIYQMRAQASTTGMSGTGDTSFTVR